MKSLNDIIERYLSGETTAAELSELLHTLEWDAEFRRQVRGLRQLMIMMGEFPSAEPAADLGARTLAAVLASVAQTQGLSVQNGPRLLGSAEVDSALRARLEQHDFLLTESLDLLPAPEPEADLVGQVMEAVSHARPLPAPPESLSDSEEMEITRLLDQAVEPLIPAGLASRTLSAILAARPHLTAEEAISDSADTRLSALLDRITCPEPPAQLRAATMLRVVESTQRVLTPQAVPVPVSVSVEPSRPALSAVPRTPRSAFPPVARFAAGSALAATVLLALWGAFTMQTPGSGNMVANVPGERTTASFNLPADEGENLTLPARNRPWRTSDLTNLASELEKSRSTFTLNRSDYRLLSEAISDLATTVKDGDSPQETAARVESTIEL